tara:strand:+ start:456 stop:1427 length:972 start_codon:yes stop_codon:yes gene_type:complete
MNEIQTKTLAEEYITADALSYSALSRLSDGPQAYINKDKPTGDFLTTGSAVDVLLTESEEEFHRQFYVMTATKPSSDMMMAYTQAMIETDNPQIAFAASGYKKAVSESKWEDEGKPYYDAIKAAKGKGILGMDQYMKVQATVNQLKENKYTKPFFSTPVEGVEINYQFIHYFEYENIKGKVKLDLLVIDHNEKTIRGIDLKTTSKPPMAFKKSYRNYKYYLQGAWFQLGIMDWLATNYNDYKLLDFQFIVAEMGAWKPPLIFTMNNSELQYAIQGGETFTGYYVKGIDILLEDLAYYKNNNQWEYPREVSENNGILALDLFKT